MDLGGWIGIIALVLAVPLGVASHLLAIRFTAFLERRKLIKTHKTRQQALLGYERIKAFHEGRRDRYPFYMLLMGSSVLIAIAASTILIIIFIVSPKFENAVLWVAISAMLVIMSVVLLSGVYGIARQLERFEDYKKEFEKQWGPIDVS